MHTGDFLSCDWGSTSLRLRWVSGADRQVVREVRERAGSKFLYEQASVQGTASPASRAALYAQCLRDKLQTWNGFAREPMPLVISGMASSSVGWKELPYARTPFRLDGADLRCETLQWEAPGWIDTTYLISGAATPHDMMRGEETEAIGLLCDPALTAWREDCLLILPGTHSKHLLIRDQCVVDFHTYMTGELLDVLGSHSLLKATTDLSALAEAWTSPARTAFQEGVLWCQRHGLARSLFRARTRGVLDQHPPADNAWFLSGVLIGGEVQDLAGRNRRILVAGSGLLGELYSTALATNQRPESQVNCLAAEQVDRAALLAHAIFLEHWTP